MADEGRSRRAARPASKAAGALARLREIRSSGAKHGAIYDIKEEEKVYDVVEEDEYADIVARRRGEGGTCTLPYAHHLTQNTRLYMTAA